MFLFLAGDAVWPDRQQRVHARLPISVHGRPGLRRRAGQRHPAAQIIAQLNFQADPTSTRPPRSPDFVKLLTAVLKILLSRDLS